MLYWRLIEKVLGVYTKGQRVDRKKKAEHIPVHESKHSYDKLQTDYYIDNKQRWRGLTNIHIR